MQICGHHPPSVTGSALITGGTGFFGKSLLSFLARRPHGDITILSRDPEAFQLVGTALLGADIAFLKGDIRDFSLPGRRFDYVIHGATSTSPKLERDNPQELRSVIVDGTRHLLEQLKASGHPVKKLLYISSGAVYGIQPPDLPRIPETHPCRPVTAYGQGKLEAEALVLASGIPAVIARCFAFVGPHLPLDAHFAAGNFIKNALEKTDIVIKGDGTPYRSYMYADDLSLWLLAMLAEARPGSVYNVGSDEAVSIAGLAEQAAKLVSPPLRVVARQRPIENKRPERYVPDVSKAAAELALRCRRGLEEALAATFAWHRNNRDCKESGIPLR